MSSTSNMDNYGPQLLNIPLWIGFGQGRQWLIGVLTRKKAI